MSSAEQQIMDMQRQMLQILWQIKSQVELIAQQPLGGMGGGGMQLQPQGFQSEQQAPQSQQY
jgi:hypothetical protein